MGIMDTKKDPPVKSWQSSQLIRQGLGFHRCYDKNRLELESEIGLSVADGDPTPPDETMTHHHGASCQKQPLPIPKRWGRELLQRTVCTAPTGSSECCREYVVRSKLNKQDRQNIEGNQATKESVYAKNSRLIREI